ncbi:MAG: hypothetical protein WDA47_07380 [Bacilli bacterium]|jgi:hypothetical protein
MGKCIESALNYLNERYYITEIIELLDLSFNDLCEYTLSELIEDRWEDVLILLGMEEEDVC